MNLNTRLGSLGPSATVALSDKIRQLKSEGKKIIALQTGDPDFNTHPAIIQACNNAMMAGDTHYSFSNGLPQLRNEISKKIQLETGAYYNPDTEIVITNGGIHALYCSLSAIINPGDEVIIQDPSWMPYKSIVELLGGIPKIINTLPANNFWATIEDYEKIVSLRTKAAIVNSPNNPTGQVASRDYLIDITAFAQRNNLFIISDEVYRSITFDGVIAPSVTSLPKTHTSTILIDSFSKSFAMTGWRVGFAAAPEDVIEQVKKCSQYTITNVPAFIQHGAIAALQDSEVKQGAKNMYRQYQHRKDLATSIFNKNTKSKIRLLEPQGAFYLFCDISATGISSVQFASRALEEAHVAIVPGNVYGEAGEGFIRMTIAASDRDIETGLNSLLDWGASL